jgi:hypothetical protein
VDCVAVWPLPWLHAIEHDSSEEETSLGRATHNEKAIVSPEVAVRLEGVKVRPPAPTATTCVAARTPEAARRAIAARKSIFVRLGRGACENQPIADRIGFIPVLYPYRIVPALYPHYTRIIGPLDRVLVILGRHARRLMPATQGMNGRNPEILNEQGKVARSQAAWVTRSVAPKRGLAAAPPPATPCAHGAEVERSYDDRDRDRVTAFRSIPHSSFIKQ